MTAASPIDAATFRALQDTAGRDFVGELVGTFLEEAPRMLAELNSAFAAGDAERFRRTAHSLKSNAATFGATELAALARALEMAGLEGARAQDPDPLVALGTAYASAAAALEAIARA